MGKWDPIWSLLLLVFLCCIRSSVHGSMRIIYDVFSYFLALIAVVWRDYSSNLRKKSLLCFQIKFYHFSASNLLNFSIQGPANIKFHQFFHLNSILINYRTVHYHLQSLINNDCLISSSSLVSLIILQLAWYLIFKWHIDCRKNCLILKTTDYVMTFNWIMKKNLINSLNCIKWLH